MTGNGFPTEAVGSVIVAIVVVLVSKLLREWSFFLDRDTNQGGHTHSSQTHEFPRCMIMLYRDLVGSVLEYGSVCYSEMAQDSYATMAT
jgi:hypothetical protein